MDGSRLYQDLLEAGVLRERASRVTLTEEFEAAVAERPSNDSPDDRPETRRFEDEQLNAYASALQGFLDVPAADIGRVLPVLLSVHRPPARTSGTPSGFVPVRGAFVAPLVSTVPASVVYVWRDDCEPCDSMRDKLGDTVADRDELLSLSVFGPDDAQLLYDEFDVAGAPTTLFFRDGTVDARLLGSKALPTIESEVEAVAPTSP